jgi:hypothetical protein
MAILPGLKESVFGISYVVNESHAHAPSGPWRIRWCILGYLLDAAQVTFGRIMCSLELASYFLNFQVIRILISERYEI